MLALKHDKLPTAMRATIKTWVDEGYQGKVPTRIRCGRRSSSLHWFGSTMSIPGFDCGSSPFNCPPPGQQVINRGGSFQDKHKLASSPARQAHFPGPQDPPAMARGLRSMDVALGRRGTWRGPRSWRSSGTSPPPRRRRRRRPRASRPGDGGRQGEASGRGGMRGEGGCGGMWWDVVGCGGMWWDVVGCGGMWWGGRVSQGVHLEESPWETSTLRKTIKHKCGTPKGTL